MVLVFNPEKLWEVCLYVSFLDVTSSCFLSLVPCLKFTLHNITAKKVTDLSLVLKDSDMESENFLYRMARKQKVQKMKHASFIGI